MIFIGYEPNTKGYHFWSKERKQVFVSTNAIFDEKVFPYCSRDKANRHTPIPIEDENLFTALDDLPYPSQYNQLQAMQDLDGTIILGQEVFNHCP